MTPRRRAPRPILARLPPASTWEPAFWARPVVNEHDCWLWNPAKWGHYGRFRGFPAHRVAYALWHGEIPTGLWVLHHCDVPACVNPSHLFVGTIDDNYADLQRKGRHYPGHTPAMCAYLIARRRGQQPSRDAADQEMDLVRARLRQEAGYESKRPDGA